MIANWQGQAAGHGAPSHDVALQVATRVGAARLIEGSITGTREHLILSARLSSVAGSELLTRAVVEGPADSLPQLIDRLAAQLLGMAAGIEGAQLASLTSTSLPAIRAFLAGQAAFRKGRMETAVLRYDEAIDLDSTFALAGLQLCRAAIWAGTERHSERGCRIAKAGRDRLSSADKVLLYASATEWATAMAQQYGGGGILVSHSGLQLQYSTVAYNTAYAAGGGVSFLDSYSTGLSQLFRSTISNNASQKTNGNGLFVVAGTLNVLGSIVAGNFNKYGLTDLSGSFSVPYCLIEAPGGASISGSGSKVGIDPDLSPLDDYGGPTATMLPNPSSPVIDALYTCDVADQRGLPGCVNSHADIGAVERQVPEEIIFRDGFETG